MGPVIYNKLKKQSFLNLTMPSQKKAGQKPEESKWKRLQEERERQRKNLRGLGQLVFRRFSQESEKYNLSELVSGIVIKVSPDEIKDTDVGTYFLINYVASHKGELSAFATALYRTDGPGHHFRCTLLSSDRLSPEESRRFLSTRKRPTILIPKPPFEKQSEPRSIRYRMSSP